MTINLTVPQTMQELRPRITVVGVGGAGCNAANNMISADLDGVDVEHALVRGDELEVDRVGHGPDGPGARDLGHEVALDLGDGAADARACGGR